MLQNHYDDFDMAKLQKHLKAQQRNATIARRGVTKLSPAEIRELNNAAIAQKQTKPIEARQPSPVDSVQRSVFHTPPLSPEGNSPSSPLVQPHPANLPTPPVSPDGERKEFFLSNGSQSPGYGPRSPSQAQSDHSSGVPSRRPSTASSYRGVTTHRGPEVTRAGSLRLQDSAQHIASNPLSSFSRPRQSPPRSSPGRYSPDQQPQWQTGLSGSAASDSANRITSHPDNAVWEHQIARKQLPPSSGAPQVRVSRSVSSRRDESTKWKRFGQVFSPEQYESEERVGRQLQQPQPLILRKQRSRSLPALLRSRSPSLVDSPIRIIDEPVAKETSTDYTALPQGLEAIDLQTRANPSTNRKGVSDVPILGLFRRPMTSTGATTERPSSGRKKERRQTLPANQSTSSLVSIKYADTIAGDRPQMKDSLKGELPSSKYSVFRDAEKAEAAKSEFGQHPAVRPHSKQSEPLKISLPTNVVKDATKPQEEEGAQEEEQQSQRQEQEQPEEAVSADTCPYPAYSRCACCGKLRKPAGFTSNLTPVLENEHLRTNFSFEMERTSLNSAKGRSRSHGSAVRPKYIPIIPMEMGNQTRQAIIEPYRRTLLTDEPIAEDSLGERDVQTKENDLINRRSSNPAGEHFSSKIPPSSTSGKREIVAPGTRTAEIKTWAREEPKVVRFASAEERKKEVERRGRSREYKARNGQEQIVPLSKLEDLYSTKDFSRPDLETEETTLEQRNSDTKEAPPDSSENSSIDIVDRMPQPPTAKCRISMTSIYSTDELSALSDSRVEPETDEDPKSPVVDLSSMAGGLGMETANPAVTTTSQYSSVYNAVVKPPQTNSYIEMDGPNTVSNPWSASDDMKTPTQAAFPPAVLQVKSSNSSDEALPLPPPSTGNRTVVRIIPSPTIPLPERSPKRPQSSSAYRSPLKLGDWELPEPSQTVTHIEQDTRPMLYDSRNATRSSELIFSPLSASSISSSRQESLTSPADVFNPSINSSSSYFQVGEIANAQVSHVVTGGSGRVREVGSNIARRMREAHRRVGVAA